MRSLEDIDSSINDLISYLADIQNGDGSFDMFYSQPYYHPEKSWMKYPAPVVYNTAQTLIPLLNFNTERLKTVFDKAESNLIQASLGEKLWTFAPISKDYIIPYDTDSTSLASFVLSKRGHSIDNKEFLNSLINSNNHYPFYIRTKGIQLPLLVQLKLNWHNHKMKRSRTLLNDDMRFSDYEFASSCVNLLYLGKCAENEKVWNQINKEIIEFTVEHVYYIDLIRSFYMYTRLIRHLKYDGVLISKTIADSYFELLRQQLEDSIDSFSQLLVLISMLHLNRDLDCYEKLIDDCFIAIDNGKFRDSNSFFSSNKNTDCQPGTDLPNTYFGSPAITCSLYIEFLNLYRKKMFGSYYGE